MAKTIGTYSFDVMNGRPLVAAEGLTVRERPGVDGSELRKHGSREAVVRITTSRTVANAAAANTLVENYRAEKGEIVQIVDADGITHDDCLILDVRARIAAVINPTSSVAHTRRVAASWTVRKRVT